MARILSILLFLLAGVLAWLSFGDRRSPTALQVVEWDTQLGVPVCAAVATAAVVFLLLSFVGRSESTVRAAPPSPRLPPPPRPDDPEPAVPMGEGWAVEVAARARALVWEEGIFLTLNAGPDVPFELRLCRATPERIRRSVGAFSAFLSAIPTPRRARVVFDQCLESEVPRHKQVGGIFERHFPLGAARTVGSRDHVDVIFARPDGRWAQAMRLP